MNRTPWIVLGFLVCLATGMAHGGMPKGEYLEGTDSKIGVIMAYDQGLDPDYQVVGPLRKSINTGLGFHTLSLHMPEAADKRAMEGVPFYASTFPEVCKRIQAAIEFLKKEKGVKRLYLLGYGMGGRMTSVFLANHPDSDIAGFISVGSFSAGDEPVDTNSALRNVRIPVLDVYAEGNEGARFAESRRRIFSKRFKQVAIPGANHDFIGHDDKVAAEVIGWLKAETR